MTLRRLVRILAVTSAVTLLFPSLVTVALISIIGIPLGLAMAAAPTLFLLTVGATLGRRAAGNESLASALSGALVALLVLAAGAFYFNGRLDADVSELRAGDRDDLPRPLRADTIALLRRAGVGGRKNESSCEGLCQRLLLSGAVRRVLVSFLDDDAVSWSPTTKAASFRLERRDACPPLLVSEIGGNSAIERGASPAEEMRLAIASGRCLVEEEAVLADADVVLAAAAIRRGQGAFSAGLRPWADTVRAQRVSVATRGEGSFVERYRWTGTITERHPPILVPTVIGGSELRTTAGFARIVRRLGDRPFSKDWNGEPDLGLLLRDEFGVDLRAGSAGASTSSDRIAIVGAALDRPGPLTSVEKRVVEDLFEDLHSWRGPGGQAADPERARLAEPLRRTAFRALADERIPAPRHTSNLVLVTSDADELVELAAVLFRRLASTDPGLKEDHPSYLGWPATYLARAIALLPPEAVKAHRADLERLAADRSMHLRACTALVQLAAFGSEAVPTMLRLADEATRNALNAEADRSAKDAARCVLRTSLLALCRAASVAPEIPDALLSRLRSGSLAPSRDDSDLIATAFVQAGADPGLLAPWLGGSGTPDERKQFERTLLRARSKRGCGN